MDYSDRDGNCYTVMIKKYTLLYGYRLSIVSTASVRFSTLAGWTRRGDGRVPSSLLLTETTVTSCAFLSSSRGEVAGETRQVFILRLI